MTSTSCKNLGCPMLFDYPTQMYRHLKKCSYPAPASSKLYSYVDDKYQCDQCGKKYSHQPSVIKHLKKCNPSKKAVLQCSICDVQFQYKSKLERHIRSHSNVKKRTSCEKTFRREDYLLNHIKVCFPPDQDESFVPSFTQELEQSVMNENSEELLDVTDNVENEPNELLHSDVNEASSPIVPMKTKAQYFKEQREVVSKTRHLETLISEMKSPVKKKVVRRLDRDSLLTDVLVNSNAQSFHEGKVVDSLIAYLKELNSQKKYSLFHSTLDKIFKDELENPDFVNWLASRLAIRHFRFVSALEKWRRQEYQDPRRRSSLSDETRQQIYDMWLKNSIPSTDARNGRNIVRLSKKNYLQSYGQLENKDVVIEEKVAKRGRKYLHANKMIITCTTRSIQKQLTDIGVDVSLGKIISLRPFFVMVASEKEISLCLCMLCLNVRMMYSHLEARAKKDNEVIPESITGFFMNSCNCAKDANGYYSWKCITGKCDQCKNIKPPQMPCQNLEEVTKYYQFETTKTPYEVIDKEGNKVLKNSKKTEKVQKCVTWETLYQQLISLKQKYLCHKYQVRNDRFHWQKVLATIENYGAIYHMDFSENISQMYKHEPQSSHFNKQQYSLHCTVNLFTAQ